jgi:hypothetical protein
LRLYSYLKIKDKYIIVDFWSGKEFPFSGKYVISNGDKEIIEILPNQKVICFEDKYQELAKKLIDSL